MKKQIKGELVFPVIDKYDYLPFKIWRNKTSHEDECIIKVNSLIKRAFEVNGFRQFFIDNHCMINDDQIKEFCKTIPVSDAELITSLFNEDNKSLFRTTNTFSKSIILDFSFHLDRYWFYDQRYLPKVEIDYNGHKSDIIRGNSDIFVFEESEYIELVYEICYRCKYNISELYSLFKILENSCRDGMDEDYFKENNPKIPVILDYCIDNDIIDFCEVIFPMPSFVWDTISTNVYIFENLRNKLKQHKKNIVALLETP
jgi:hypothetical protein